MGDTTLKTEEPDRAGSFGAARYTNAHDEIDLEPYIPSKMGTFEYGFGARRHSRTRIRSQEYVSYCRTRSFYIQTWLLDVTGATEFFQVDALPRLPLALRSVAHSGYY